MSGRSERYGKGGQEAPGRNSALEELRRRRESLEELVAERTTELAGQSRIAEAFFKYSLSPLVLLDREFNFIRVNDAYANVCARDIADFAGHNHFVDYPSDELKEKFERVVRTREPYTVFTRPFVFPDHPEWGTTYWDLHLYPILDDKGEIDFLVFSLNDVTKRKRAEDEAQKLQKLESLQVLAGGIAHDLNNLMLAITANAGLALKSAGPDSPARGYIENIEDGAEKVSAFSRQILSFTGKGEAAREAVRINEVVRETGQLLMASISKKAALHYALSEGLPFIEADPQNMRQVVMNLVINASDALGDNEGIITISTGMLHAAQGYLDGLNPADLPEGEYAYIEVSDTGAGMSQETRRRLFEPFYTTKFTGRGLGLPVVFGIAKAHGGAVGVETEDGRGTKFRVLLPVAATVLAPAAVRPVPRGAWSGKGTILVLDDDEGVLYAMEQALRMAGYTVLTAQDGRQAIETFRENAGSISAAVIDLLMPAMRGDEVVRELRKIKGDLNVLLTSGYHDLDLDDLTTGPGRTEALAKPYKLAKFLEKVREVASP